MLRDHFLESDTALRQVEAQVFRHVADLVDEDDAVRESPLTADSLEAIFVAAAHDRLKGELRSRLEHDIVGAASGRVSLLFDLDPDIRG
jgi:hypothetical protein